MIDPALDVWVWGAAGLLLLLMGARAWVAETGSASVSGPPRRARTLAAAVALSLMALVSLLAVQGGATLVSEIVRAKLGYPVPGVNAPDAPAPAPAGPAAGPAAPAGN